MIEVGDTISWRGTTPPTSTTKGDVDRVFSGIVSEVCTHPVTGEPVAYLVEVRAQLGAYTADVRPENVIEP